MRFSKSLIFMYTAILLFSCEEANESPVIFQATYDGGTSSSSIMLRADSTCQWLNGTAIFGSNTINEGTYRLQDSMIVLKGIQLDKVLQSNYLVITQAYSRNSNFESTRVYQVDSTLKPLDNHFNFTIYVDKRDSLQRVMKQNQKME